MLWLHCGKNPPRIFKRSGTTAAQDLDDNMRTVQETKERGTKCWNPIRKKKVRPDAQAAS